MFDNLTSVSNQKICYCDAFHQKARFRRCASTLRRAAWSSPATPNAAARLASPGSTAVPASHALQGPTRRRKAAAVARCVAKGRLQAQHPLSRRIARSAWRTLTVPGGRRCRYCTLHPAPCTLHPAPCTLLPAPCTLHPAPCTLHPAPCTLHPLAWYPATCTLRPNI